MVNKRVAMLLIPLVLAACAGLDLDVFKREPEPEPTPSSEPTPSPGPRAAPERKPTAAVLDPADPETGKRSRKQTLIASGFAPLDGDDVGYYMDIQEASLRRELGGAGVDLRREGDSITLTMPGQLTFDANSVTLKPAARSLLHSIVGVLAEYDKTLIAIYGHTDDAGDEGYNRHLSERRAMSLARYLTNHGVEADRIVVIGLGESAPIADNSTEAGRESNRRVELQIEPIYGEG